MRIHFIMHESFEAPGTLITWAEQKNHHLSFSKVYQYEPLPSDIRDFDFLIILGGPQSPTTSQNECPYFDAQAEIALIQQAISANKLVLGICLGAQLIGAAYDARHEQSPHKEIGVFDIHLNAASRNDIIFKTLPDTLPAAHWHGDMPGLSSHATVLAYSEACPRQIIRYAYNVYGFQCHPEFTLDVVKELIANCEHELKDSANNPYIQNKQILLAQDYTSMNQWLFKFLDQFTALHTHHIIMEKLVQYTKLNHKNTPYGACIANKNNEIVAYGLGDDLGSPTAHAEIEAIQQCAKKFPEINWSELTLYSTGEPCIMCSSACCWAGFKSVVYGTDIKFMQQLWGIEANMTTMDIFNATPHSPQLIANICAKTCNNLFTEFKDIFTTTLAQRKKLGRGHSSLNILDVKESN